MNQKSKMIMKLCLNALLIKLFIIQLFSLSLGLGCLLLPTSNALANISNKYTVNAKEKNADLLKKAESLRGTDGIKFSALLKQLENARSSLTLEQTYHFDYFIAYQQSILGQTDAALETFIKIFHETQNIDLKFKVGYTIFNVLAISRKFVESLSYYNQTMHLYPEIKDAELKQTALLASMMLFNELGDFNKVISIKQTPELASLSGSLLCKGNALEIRAQSNIGDVELTNGRFKRALADCHDANQPLYETFIRLDYVRALLKQNSLTIALTELESHLPISLSTQYKLIIQEYYYLMAKTYWLLGKKNEAQVMAQRALETSVSDQYSLPLTLTLELSYQMAKQRGDFELALHYAEQYAQADKGYLNQLRVKAMALEMNKAEVLEQQQRIEILKRENQLLTLAQALERKENANVQLLIAVLLLCLLSVCIWAYRSKLIQRELARLAQMDELTQVYNRRQLVQLGGQVLALTERNKAKVSVIMVDLDFFKSINDKFGHNVGDWALKRVAKTLNVLGRKSDVFGRLGGEEFAFVLSDCSLEQALGFAELCRIEIATIDVSDSLFPDDLSLSASFGVTDTDLSGYDLDNLLADADKALYQAKGLQRNCVVKFEAHAVTDTGDTTTDTADDIWEDPTNATIDGSTSDKKGPVVNV